MRKTLLAAATAASIALSGCATTGGQISITDVQNAAVAACGFLPTASTVAAIIASGTSIGPAVSGVASIAAAICAAVAPAKGGKLRGVPTVNGVEVHGKFVR